MASSPFDLRWIRGAADLIEVLEARAASTPDRIAYAFLADPDDESTPPLHLTYRALRERAAALAADVQAHGASGQAVLLVYPPGLEFIAAVYGCMAAGAIPVPTSAPLHAGARSGYRQRLHAIATDARVRLVLTTRGTHALLQDEGGVAAPVYATDAAPAAPPVPPVPLISGPTGARSELALIQYTSGSTANPKGAAVTHAQLMANLAMWCDGYPLDDESVLVNWLPHYHDLSLIGHLLLALYVGAPCYSMDPLAFAQKPLRWLRAITRFRGTFSGAPNFAYEICARKVSEAQKASLDLGSWRVALNGAEPVRGGTLERFVTAFAGCGFRAEACCPAYGLSEATAIVAGGAPVYPSGACAFRQSDLERCRVREVPAGSRDSVLLIGCGRPLLDTSVLIVEPTTSEPAAPGCVGEIWVSGPAVAQGYWNRPEQTAETFSGQVSSAPDRRYLRTGDLGFLHRGQLYVTGRRKETLLVRGAVHHPHDIEQTVESAHPAFRAGGAAAFPIDEAEEERLVILEEVEPSRYRPEDADACCQAILQAVASSHGIDVYAVALLERGALPKTTSGKLQRAASRAAYLAGTLPVLATFRAPAGVSPLADPPPPAAAPGLVRFLRERIAALAQLPLAQISESEPFAQYGLGSLALVTLSGELAEHLGRPLSPTLLYEYPTAVALAAHLGGADPAPSPARSAPAPAAPIAVIGMSCRFPGAPSVAAFWQLLREGRDAIQRVPGDRWDVEGLYDPRPGIPGKFTTKWAGTLPDLDRFDARFFGVSPREADRMDPQQRHLLELSWLALEDAGLVPSQLRGQRVGVFVGISQLDYGIAQYNDLAGVDPYFGTGVALSIAANRISYTFDFRGPSLSVDTACSSSLTAVHLAVRSLRAGESVIAVVGGANIVLSPAPFMNFVKAGLMAADGRCKPFSADADGLVRSEGAGVVVLKPLARALADGDRVHAVILGSAIAQDGRTNGLMAPSRAAQEALLEEALRDAGVPASALQYVEAHGTGTRVGDVVEASALLAVRGRSGRNGRNDLAPLPLRLGSVKSNLGHLESAAGIAGLIKTTLALRDGQIPASLHAARLNPNIAFDPGTLLLQRELAPWPTTAGERLAGVSAFGFGGSLAHLVLAAPPPRAVAPPPQPRAYVLPLSARTAAALHELAAAYRARLADPVPLRDLGYSAAVRRDHLEHRRALVGSSTEELQAQLADFLARPEPARHEVVDAGAGARAGLIWVFPGQGAALDGPQLRQLCADEPVFAEALRRCDEVMQALLSWSVRAALQAGGDALERVEVAQPVLFALQAALCAWWRSCGVTPAAVLGHSRGEVAAAYAAGALTLEAAAQIVVQRSRLLRAVDGKGAMLVVELDGPAAARAIAPCSDRVSVAAYNGPRATVLAGDPEALRTLAQQLTAEQVSCRPVAGAIAFHSPQMDPLCSLLAEALQGLAADAPKLPFFSTVTGAQWPEVALTADYWVQNLRQPVRFADAVAAALSAGPRLFLEISPSPTLLGAIEQNLQAGHHSGRALPTLRRGQPGRAQLLQTLGALYEAGYPVEFSGAYSDGGQLVDLPGYPFERERYWYTPTGDVAAPAAPRLAPAVHPLLGAELPVAAPEERYFYRELTQHSLPWLRDHAVAGRVVVPGAAFLEMALAAATRVLGADDYVLTDVRFLRMLILSDAPVQLQLALRRIAADHADFEVLSRGAAGGDWQRHAQGGLRRAGAESPAPPPPWTGALQPQDTSAFYAALWRRGLTYGPAFRGLSQIQGSPGHAAAQLPRQTSTDGTLISPAVLDSCFQVAAATGVAGDEDSLHRVPVSVASLRWFAAAGPPRTCRAAARPLPDGDPRRLFDIWAEDEQGRLALTVSGLCVAPTHTEEGTAVLAEALHRVAWKQRPAPALRSAAGLWLVLAGPGELGEALAAQLAQAGWQWALVTPGAATCRLSEQRYAVDLAAPDAFADLLALLGGAPAYAGVVYAGPLTTPDDTDPAAAAEREGLLWLRFLRGFAAQRAWTRLWLLTRGGQAVDETEGVDPVQAALWGLGATLAREHPTLRLRRLDLASTAAPGPEVLQELAADDPEERVALRNGVRYGQRLLSQPAAAPARPPVTADASYLITGGLGGLGLKTAEWLVDQGARHLVLVGRRAPDAHAAAVLEALRARGATVQAVQADIADADAVATLFAEGARAWPALRGVVHAAGVLDDCWLGEMTAERFTQVFRTKAAGAWHLYRQTAAAPLDWLVLFSSFSALMGPPGQANYAAANAFLDGLAHSGRAAGRRVLSINWGPWAEVGMAARDGGGQRLRRGFLRDLAPSVGVAALGAVLNQPVAQAAVVSFANAASERNAVSTGWFQDALLSELHAPTSPAAPAQVAAAASPAVALDGIDREARQQALGRYLLARFAEIQRMAPSRAAALSRTASLVTQGLDSLMAMELQASVLRDYGVALPLHAMLQGGSAAELAALLEEQLASVSPPAPQGDDDSVDDILL